MQRRRTFVAHMGFVMPNSHVEGTYVLATEDISVSGTTQFTV